MTVLLPTSLVRRAMKLHPDGTWWCVLRVPCLYLGLASVAQCSPLTLVGWPNASLKHLKTSVRSPLTWVCWPNTSYLCIWKPLKILSKWSGWIFILEFHREEMQSTKYKKHKENIYIGEYTREIVQCHKAALLFYFYYGLMKKLIGLAKL